MKKLILLAILLAAPHTGFGIAFKSYTPCLQNNQSLTACVFAPIAIAPGDVWIFNVWNSVGNPGSISDTCNLPWAKPGTGATGTWVVLSTITGTGTGGTCTVTFTRTGNSNFVASITDYSNVGSLGPYQLNGAVTGSCVGTRTLSSAGNYLATFPIFSAGSGNGFVQGAVVGNLRGATTGTTYTVATVDAVATAAGQSVTTSYAYTNNATPPCYSGSIELVVPASASRYAARSDGFKTVLLSTATSATYLLPATLLASNFCSYVMPTGPTNYTYTISAQTGTQLNNQTANMIVPPWQMVRVCEDASGNYWANPPFVAGAGIYILPSPTGITISTSPLGRAASAPPVAKGLVRLGGVAVAAGRCSAPIERRAAEVRSSDVVDHSNPNWNSAYLEPWAFAEDGEVNFEVCNSGPRAIIPRPAMVTWYVRR